MNAIIILLMIIYSIIVYTHPWIDKFKDYRDEERLVLWYTNYKGERKFIQLK